MTVLEAIHREIDEVRQANRAVRRILVHASAIPGTVTWMHRGGPGPQVDIEVHPFDWLEVTHQAGTTHVLSVAGHPVVEVKTPIEP